MPKSNFLRKKSKTGSSADFKRLKAKVGKKAHKAANHTDTSFKSVRVRVTAQSVLSDLGDSDAIIARGQSVQELLVQLRHYNPANKCDALAGLKSIVEKHPGFAETNFARLSEPSLELLVNIEDSVRSALLSYQEALLARVTSPTFNPFADLYVAYTVSAMTSLHRAVRRSSLSLLDLLLSRFPGAIAARSARLAPNYPALLLANPSSKKQPGRAGALQSFSGLLRAVATASSHQGGANPNPVMRTARPPLSSSCLAATGMEVRMVWRSGSARNRALFCRRVSMLSVAEGGAGPGAGAKAAGGVRTNSGGGGAAVAFGPSGSGEQPPEVVLGESLPLVLERVREVWIEALAAEPLDTALLQCVVDALLQVARNPSWMGAGAAMGRHRDSEQGQVVGSSGAGGSNGSNGVDDSRGRGAGAGGEGAPVAAWMQSFIPLALEAFPLRPTEGELAGGGDTGRLQELETLNMGICELVVAVIGGGGCSMGWQWGGGRGVAGKRGQGQEITVWLSPVLEHVHEKLREMVGGGGDAERRVPSILRVLRAALNSAVAGHQEAGGGWASQRHRLLSAFTDFYQGLPPSGYPRQSCVQFICWQSRAMLAQPTLGRAEAGAVHEVRLWLETLPNLLLKWGGGMPNLSSEVSCVLLEMAKRSSSVAAPGAGGVGEDRKEGRGGMTKGSMPQGAAGRSGSGTAATRAGAVAAGTGMPSKGGAHSPEGQPDFSSTPSPMSMQQAWASEAAALLQSIRSDIARIFTGGVFLALPPETQLNLVSLLYHLPTLPRGLLPALATICSETSAAGGDVRVYILEVMHHRRQALTPSVYLGFLMSILTGKASLPPSISWRNNRQSRGGEVPKTGAGEGGRGGNASEGSGLATAARKRKWKGSGPPDHAHVSGSDTLSPSWPPSAGGGVFGRDEVTTAVCRSIRMLCSRGGGPVMEALCPTLLGLLLGEDVSGRERDGAGATKVEGLSEDADSDHREEKTRERNGGGAGVARDLVLLLQRQRIAVACVLCCSTSGAATGDPPPDHLPPVERTLIGPLANACAMAMGKAEAGSLLDQGEEEGNKSGAWGGRLLQPVVALMRSRPWVFRATLEQVVGTVTSATHDSASACGAATDDGARGGEGGVMETEPTSEEMTRPEEGMEGGGGGGWSGGGRSARAVEPVLRCLQGLLHHPLLQEQLQKDHKESLVKAAASFHRSLGGSPLRPLVQRISADVALL